MSSNNMTQLKANDLVEIQDRLKVMMKALIGKIDELSTEMISRHDVHSYKEHEAKRSTRWAFSLLDKSVEETFDDEEDESVVNHEKSLIHTKILYMRHE